MGIVIEQKYAELNNCFKSGKIIKPKGLMVHSVGCNQPSREVFATIYNSPNPNGRKICPHGFLDDSGFTQLLPWEMRCWGCGSGTKGSYNDSHIQIEICEPASMEYDKKNGALLSYNPANSENNAYFNKCRNNAAELFAMLCLKFGLPVSSIVSHKEAHALGYASNHGDPEHWWSYHMYTMDDFRNDVSRVIERVLKEEAEEKYEDYLGGGSVEVDKLNQIIQVPFMVKVSIKNLNIRKGPGKEYPSVGQILPAIYTITGLGNGYGFLKSTAGWIDLSCTEVINN